MAHVNFKDNSGVDVWPYCIGEKDMHVITDDDVLKDGDVIAGQRHQQTGGRGASGRSQRLVLHTLHDAMASRCTIKTPLSDSLMVRRIQRVTPKAVDKGIVSVASLSSPLQPVPTH